MKTPLLVGALGGITPNLLTLAVQLTTKDAELPTLTYLIGLVIFAGLGAGIAYAWEERKPKRAFYLGLGLPSLIQLNVANLGAPPPQSPPAPEPALKAEAKRQEPQALNRKLVLVPGEIADAAYYQVVFIREAGARVERYSSVPIEPRRRVELTVPDFATCAMVQVSSDSFGGRICWPSEPNVVRTARLDVTRRLWSGLLRSLGVTGRGDYRITLTPSEPD
jgi:hypothetical protein